MTHKSPALKWDPRELRWVGLAFDPDEPECDDAAAIILINSRIPLKTPYQRLTDGTIVQPHNLPFGLVHVFRSSDGTVTGFGIRVNNHLTGSMLVGKANRVLGSLGIDQDATVWAKTIFARPEVPA